MRTSSSHTTIVPIAGGYGRRREDDGVGQSASLNAGRVVSLPPASMIEPINSEVVSQDQGELIEMLALPANVISAVASNVFTLLSVEKK